MKHLIYIICSFIIISCSKDDDHLVEGLESKVLEGTWYIQGHNIKCSGDDLIYQGEPAELVFKPDSIFFIRPESQNLKTITTYNIDGNHLDVWTKTIYTAQNMVVFEGEYYLYYYKTDKKYYGLSKTRNFHNGEVVRSCEGKMSIFRGDKWE
ncbi:MAG: hypothetical protein ACPG6V_12745 [Flavobacteriales bacterium]